MKEFSVYDDDDDSGNCQNDSQIILVQKVLSVMDDELILAFYHEFFIHVYLLLWRWKIIILGKSFLK